MRPERPDVIDIDEPRFGRREERTSVTVAHHQGPLPPPSYLAEYEAAHQGAAGRILAMAEKEQNFRHEVTRKQAKFPLRGQIFAFFLLVGGLAVSGLAVHKGFDTSAAAMLAATLGAGTVVAFFRREPAAKKKGDA